MPNLKTMVVATIALPILTACGSGGERKNDPPIPSQNPQDVPVTPFCYTENVCFCVAGHAIRLMRVVGMEPALIFMVFLGLRLDQKTDLIFQRP